MRGEDVKVEQMRGGREDKIRGEGKVRRGYERYKKR